MTITDCSLLLLAVGFSIAALCYAIYSVLHDDPQPDEHAEPFEDK